jgi:hypothetical protein
MKRVICPLAVWLALSVAAALASAADSQGSRAVPGGVTDSAGKVGYLTNPKGGIVAVGLEKGTVLWESKAGT